MALKVAKDTPLFELTLRKYEKPHSQNKRDLVKRVCLSLGLLQPGDSRNVIVDILYVLLNELKNKDFLTTPEIRERVIQFRKENNLSDLGCAESNLRRQLLRLRELELVEKKNNGYAIKEFMSLEELFSTRIKNFLLRDILDRIEQYMISTDNKFTEE